VSDSTSSTPSDPNAEYARTLQAEIDRLNAANEALVQEFTKDSTSCTPERVHEKVTELVPNALTQLEFMLNHAKSESVRASIARYILDIKLDKKGLGDSPDAELGKILAGLKKND
jgi:hypothetical protein